MNSLNSDSQGRKAILHTHLGAFLGGPPSQDYLMINLLSHVDTYDFFQYKKLHLNNLHINTILFINFSDVDYMNNNDGHI